MSQEVPAQSADFSIPGWAIAQVISSPQAEQESLNSADEEQQIICTELGIFINRSKVEQLCQSLNQSNQESNSSDSITYVLVPLYIHIPGPGPLTQKLLSNLRNTLESLPNDASDISMLEQLQALTDLTRSLQAEDDEEKNFPLV